MKSDRLLSTLMLLQAHGRLSTREVAERLEISQRTAHRDMEALCTAGIPLIAHRGSTGGWELQKGWRTKVPGLDDAELQALLMAQPSALGDRKLTAAAQRAFDKLMASMPTSMRLQAHSIQARLHIDPTGWRPSPEDLSMLPIVQDALARDCKFTFLYTRADGELSSRTVDPLGLVCKQTVWYLIAQSSAGTRTYRISRMREVVVLALPSIRPPDFDLAAHWKQSTAALKDRHQTIATILALSDEGVASIERWCPMVPELNHRASRTLPRGWRLFHIEFESFQQARFVVLGLGSRAAAIAPPELCKDIKAELRRMLRPQKKHERRPV